MTRSSLHSAEVPVRYQSGLTLESVAIPGVRFTVARISFGRRTELFRRIREISCKLPFLEASSDFAEQVEANLLGQEVEELYLRWGLKGLEGLEIDDEPADLEALIERGPEELVREILTAVKSQCGLSEEERKN